MYYIFTIWVLAAMKSGNHMTLRGPNYYPRGQAGVGAPNGGPARIDHLSPVRRWPMGRAPGTTGLFGPEPGWRSRLPKISLPSSCDPRLGPIVRVP
jgi:hypothetical protein